MSKNTAPGICPTRYSSCALRRSLGSRNVPSMITRSGSPRCAASHSVETNRLSLIVGLSLKVGRFDLDAAFEPMRHGKMLLAQKLGIVEFRKIARAGIGEDRNNRMARAEFFREPHCTDDVDGRRTAKQQAFIRCKVEQNGQSLRVGDLIGNVDGGVF